MIRSAWFGLAMALAGCAGRPDGMHVAADKANYAYQNDALTVENRQFQPGAAGDSIASSDIPWRIPPQCRVAYRAWRAGQHSAVGRQGDWLALGRCAAPAKSTFVAAAITGGGNKSAVYAAEVLFELERYGLTQNIDVVSSVSGGSFTAALYALSCDPADKAPCTSPPDWVRPRWEYKDISARLEANYLWSFMGRRLLPWSLAENGYTHRDSADSLAETIGSRLLREPERRLRFADLNPQRPNLILNATNTTRDRAALDQDASIPENARRPLSDDDALHFSFTQQYFWRMLSRLDTYPLRDAITASAAFPLLIDRPSLRVFREEDLRALAGDGEMRPPSYVSLYDGGVHDNFGVTELRWFMECQFGRNARRTVWTEIIRQRECGDRQPVKPRATLILGINSSLLRTSGVSPLDPKPRSWDSYLALVRLSGTSDSVDLIMAASGELRKMELRSLVEEISRAEAGRVTPENPFIAPGRHQYVDIDLEAALYMSCPGRIAGDGSEAGPSARSKEIILNTANGSTERRRCDALKGVLHDNITRQIDLPTVAPGFCSTPDCPELDAVVGDRTLGEPEPKRRVPLFFDGANANGPRLISNQLLFGAIRDVPTSFELSAQYVRLLRYVARWAVAHRVWELCHDHPDLVETLPGGIDRVCVKPLPARAAG